jgi:hypothetical protein
LGEEVGRQRAFDVDAERRLHAQALHLEDGRHAVPHIHLDRKRDRDLRAGVAHRFPSIVGHPGHVDEQIVGPKPDVMVAAALARGQLVEDRTYPERRKDVRRNRQTELAPDLPRLFVDCIPKVDFAAHDHRDELVG